MDLYFKAVQELQKTVIASQRVVLDQVAERMTSTVLQDKRIFIFGTGHSHMLVEEGFYRAGGLAAVVPIFSAALMLHENADLSGRLERMAGLAGPLLERYAPQPGEMIFVYSNSGVNRLPVEMAMAARDHGLAVVSVLSRAYAAVAPLSAAGKRLPEVSDYVIDNGGEPGDGLVPVDDFGWRVGPSSTVVNALIWNCLVVETALRLRRAGIVDLPIFASLNLPGAEAHNQALLDKWRKVNPHL